MDGWMDEWMVIIIIPWQRSIIRSRVILYETQQVLNLDWRIVKQQPYKNLTMTSFCRLLKNNKQSKSKISYSLYSSQNIGSYEENNIMNLNVKRNILTLLQHIIKHCSCFALPEQYQRVYVCISWGPIRPSQTINFPIFFIHPAGA